MQRIATTLLSMLLFVTFASSPAAAQMENDDSSPMGAKTVFPRIGFQGGFDLNVAEGIYSVGCGTFDGGSGLNVIFGGAYEYPIADHFKIEGILGIRTRNLSDSYVTAESSIVQVSDQFVEAEIDYDNVGSLSIAYLFLQPAITWYPFWNFYIGAGVNAGVPLGASMGYQRNLVTRTVTDNDGRVVEIFYPLEDSPNPDSRRFPDEEPEELNPLVIEPVLLTGLELRLGRDWFIGPRFSYAFVNSPAIRDPELTFSSFTATLALRTHLR